MKRTICKILLLITFFLFFFIFIQNIFLTKNKERQALRRTYKIYNQNKGKIDVCFIGSSPIHNGISPMVLWKQWGISSLNFAISYQTALLSYFQLKSLVIMQKPQLVVIDLCSLFGSRKADDQMYENTYRAVVMAELNFINKFECICSILKDNKKQRGIYYFLPFFLYRRQWSQLRLSDFESVYKKYYRGELFFIESYSDLKLPDGYVDAMSRGNVSEYSLKYYEKIFSLCRRENIRIFVINMPKNEMRWTGERIEKCKEICKKHGICFVDFNSKEELDKLNFNLKKDFCNQSHMNVRGCIKFSRVLAQKIKELYSLEDHRNDPEYADWQRDYEEFYQDYKDVFESLGE